MQPLNLNNPNGGKIIFVNRQNKRYALPFRISEKISKKMEMRSTATLELQNPKIMKIATEIRYSRVPIQCGDKTIELFFAIKTGRRPEKMISKAKLRTNPMAGVTTNFGKASLAFIAEIKNGLPLKLIVIWPTL